jgi:phage tail tape-measure protein
VLTLGATYLTYVDYKHNENMTQTEAVMATGIVTGVSVGGSAVGAAIGTACGPLAPACVPMYAWAGGVGGGLLGEVVVSRNAGRIEWAARLWDEYVPPVDQWGRGR